MTLVLEIQNIELNDETKYSTFNLALKAEIIINESDIDGAYESIYSRKYKS